MLDLLRGLRDNKSQRGAVTPIHPIYRGGFTVTWEIYAVNRHQASDDLFISASMWRVAQAGLVRSGLPERSGSLNRRPDRARNLRPPEAIGKWSGTGYGVTTAFSAPASGDYIVSWNYSGNVDGSTETTGVTPGRPESFNVQAAGQWTIKVVAAQ